MEHKYTNQLINSSSPYLLQHAHNPVNWLPWSDKSIRKAKLENKLILVSIGYAACHWCHVMEHESFEDLEVARVMNERFVCIKVDREERPDVDNYYMTAVQLMQQQGGWPLNVISLPDGRPIWGGTYFPKNIWMKNLHSISDYYSKNKKQTEDYAAKLQEGIIQSSLVEPVYDETNFDSGLVEKGIDIWKNKFDLENGGSTGAPKFPMPVNLDFLMYYAYIKKENSILNFVEITLEKMARGGIYDQAGGGFARYSVDEKWKVPHFEKMLYDNGQLLSLYSKGYQLFKNDEFKNVVYETIEFLEREMLDSSGAFYSSLDADSEGEEGRFYVWKENELREILNSDFELFASYFNVNSKGYWENGNYILLRNQSDEEFSNQNELSQERLKSKIDSWKNDLFAERSKRIRPGLDDKSLTSWNALVISGLLDSYKALRDDRILDLAKRNANFLKENIISEKGEIFHSWKKGKASVNGFLEDYALAIQAFISMFEITGEELWLFEAITLINKAINDFYDSKTGLFFFSKKDEESIIVNHFQKEDNVIPAANSVMANNLHKLYLLLANPDYKKMSDRMLQYIIPNFSRYPMAYANWGNLMLKKTEPFYEVAVVGEKAESIIKEMQIAFRPNVLWAFSKSESNIPIFSDRLVNDKTLIYVCSDNECDLPVSLVDQAIEKID